MFEEKANVLEKINYLHENKNWRELLKYGETLHPMQKCSFLWSWPTVEGLDELKLVLKNLNINRLVSIGCGNGLFEWILKEAIGIEVFGLEVDKLWWQSSYSVKSFIKLNFFEDCVCKNLFQEICCAKDWNFAILFSFFNNRTAFLNYLDIYNGKWILLIGPSITETHIHTDPSPLQPNFPISKHWELRSKINLSCKTILAIYEKK